MTCSSHGWRSLAPFSWDADNRKLCFAAYLGKEPVDIEAYQQEQEIVATIISHQQLTDFERHHADTIIIRALSLDVDTEGLLEIAHRVGPEYVEIINRGAGRLLKAPTLWEDAAKTLFTTNCTWALTKKICEAACSPTFSTPSPLGNYPFPDAECISSYGEEQLKKLIPVGYRAAYFIPLASQFAVDPSLHNIQDSNFSFKEADKLVRASKGFGNYATAHLLLLCGYFNEVPVDTVVVSYLKENYRVRKPHSFIDRNYRKWNKYKWWGLKLEQIIRHQNWLGETNT